MVGWAFLMLALRPNVYGLCWLFVLLLMLTVLKLQPTKIKYILADKVSMSNKH